jgi:hypothetical protein
MILKKREVRNCSCGAKPNELHMEGCDVERCPRCGGQNNSCSCIYEVCDIDYETMEEEHPTIYNEGPTEEMYDRWDKEWGERRVPWSGEWPGAKECRLYGFWSIFGPDMDPPQRGWVSVPAGTPGAGEDLNRLAVSTWWNIETQTYELHIKNKESN